MYSLLAVPLLLLRLCLQVCLGRRPTDGRNADSVLIILLHTATRAALDQSWTMSCSSAEGGGSQALMSIQIKIPVTRRAGATCELFPAARLAAHSTVAEQTCCRMG